ARRLALQSAQIIQLGPPNLARAHHIDMVNHLGVYREDPLHALAEADLAHRDALAHAGAVACNDGALKGLEPFLVAFLNLDVDFDGVSGPEGGDGVGPFVLVDEFLQERVLHGNVLNLPSYTKREPFRTAADF